MIQAKGLLLAADGVANNEIARRCDATPNAVRWRSKFTAEGIEGVGRIRPGRGRKPELASEVIEAIVHDKLHTDPERGRHGRCQAPGRWVHRHRHRKRAATAPTDLRRPGRPAFMPSPAHQVFTSPLVAFNARQLSNGIAGSPLRWET